MNNLTRKGIKLSWLLRHDSESFNKGLIDEHGWRRVNEIVKDYGFSEALIQEIVATNNKQRYEFNSNKTMIRARQGHSIPVDVELKEATDITKDRPYLWHGTSERFIESIKTQGLVTTPGSRLYVHLSGDKDTAYKVGQRHGGTTIVICIDAYQMILDDKKIYISNNGVYNVIKVEPEYFVSITRGV